MDVTWQPRRVDWNAHTWTMTSLYKSVGVVDIVEWACVLCGCRIQNEQVEQWIASNCVLSLNIPPWKLFGWFRRPQLRATGDWQLHPDNAPTHASRLMQNFFAKHQIIQVTQPPYSPDFPLWNFWLLPKLKSPLKGKRFQTVNETQESTTVQLMVTGRTVWGPKVPALKGPETSWSCV